MPERPKNVHAESDTMLDKSLPYKSIIMRMEAAVAERLAPPAPAAGYRIRPFVPGDERHWARIETSVGEFSEEAAARAYFERVYLPEAALRCLFVVTERDEPVATATTWAEEEASLRQLQLQWVAVEPAHQGRGLGRAIATAAVRRAVRLAPAKRSCCIRRHGATGPCGSTAASDSASAARRRSSCGARRGRA